LFDDLTIQVSLLYDGRQATYWLYLLSSLFIAIIYLAPRAKFIPIHILTHRSARRDYVWFMINNTFALFLLLPLVSGYSQFIVVKFDDFLPLETSTLLQDMPSIWIDLLYTFTMFISYDLTYFLIHKRFHTDPMLWLFHQVHHNAEVLTPVTVFRVHPVETLIKVISISTVLSITHHLFSYITNYTLTLLSITGANVFLWLFFITGYHLRHSHIAVHYPRVVSFIFMSPIQHQCHHSNKKALSNSNYGFALSIWDSLNRSVYIPNKGEVIELPLKNVSLSEQLSVPCKIAIKHYPLKSALLFACLLAPAIISIYHQYHHE